MEGTSDPTLMFSGLSASLGLLPPRNIMAIRMSCPFLFVFCASSMACIPTNQVCVSDRLFAAFHAERCDSTCIYKAIIVVQIRCWFGTLARRGATDLLLFQKAGAESHRG